MTPILIIALEFAPVQTTGAFRSIDFAKYLPEFGFEPRIVTIKPEHGSRIFGAMRNEDLLSGLPSCVHTHHLTPQARRQTQSRFGQYLRHLTSLDDDFYRLFRESFAATLEQIRHLPPVAGVYVSAPPFGAAKLGEVAAETLKVPWVLDMRDPWSEWSMSPFTTFFHYRAQLRDETRAFMTASAIVTVTDRLRDLFRRTHPSLPSSKFRVVPNGFDGPLLDGGLSRPPSAKNTFDIIYVGNFYYSPPKSRTLLRPHRFLHYFRGTEDWSYRSPLYFFKAWQRLGCIDPDAAARIRFHHIGNPPAWLAPMAAEHGLKDRCKLWGVLPKQEISSVLAGMDAQLATSMKRPEGGDYCLASKTFDYILARRPILAFVTEGAQRDFLAASGAAVICDPDDARAAAEAMRGVMAGNASPALETAYVNRFHRRETTRRLAEILREVLFDDPHGVTSLQYSSR